MQKTYIFLALGLLFAVSFSISCSSSTSVSTVGISEEQAKRTVEILLNELNKNSTPSNPPRTLAEWQCLVQVSPTEINGKAVINYSDFKLKGNFVFLLSVNSRQWIIDRAEFRSDSGTLSWNQYVFQKVE
jgi:hypothetical protein